MEPKPPTIPGRIEEETILSFEEFSERDENNHPNYNNFFKYFMMPEIYSNTKHYGRFISENADLNSALCDKIQNEMSRTESTGIALKPFDRDLYEAYKIMRSYDVTDLELFS